MKTLDDAFGEQDGNGFDRYFTNEPKYLIKSGDCKDAFKDLDLVKLYDNREEPPRVYVFSKTFLETSSKKGWSFTGEVI